MDPAHYMGLNKLKMIQHYAALSLCVIIDSKVKGADINSETSAPFFPFTAGVIWQLAW